MDDPEVAEDHHREDAPDEMVDVRAADLDVPRPPAHLLVDHPGAGADEAEGAEQGDEEQERRQPSAVDDLAMELAADGGDDRDHSRTVSARGGPAEAAQGVRTTLPTLRRSAMNRCASAARSNGNASATTGAYSPRLEPRGERLEDAVETLGVPPLEHVEAEDALVLVHHLEALPPRHRRQRHPREPAQHCRESRLSPVCTSESPYITSRPPGTQDRVVLAKARRADRVDDQVEADAAGDPHRLGGEVRVAVVDRVLDALGADRVVLGGRGGAEDLGADPACAIWVAAIPTPPAAAWIRTRSPRFSPPMITSAA